MLFIRPDNLPVAIYEGFNGRDIVFVNNVLETADAELAAQLVSMGFELVQPEDPRYEWIIREGWSRHSQADFLRNNPQPEEEPAEEE